MWNFATLILVISSMGGFSLLQYLPANLSLSSPTWDLVIILFFLVAAFLYGLSLGRNRIIIILISIYMSIALINTFPFVDYQVAELKVGESFVLRITIFLAAVLLLFFFLSRSALRSAFKYPKKDDGSWWQVFMFSVLHVGLLVSVIVSFLPPSSVDNLAPLTKKIFATSIAQFLWVLLPIVAMVFIKKKKDVV